MVRNFQGNPMYGINFIKRTHRARVMEALAPYGFPPPTYDVAAYISRHPGTSQDRIVTVTCYDKATVARSARRLEELGYLRRSCNESDRRQNVLYLTDAGEKFAAEVERVNSSWNETLMRGFTDMEREVLLGYLCRMAENIEG